MVGHGALVSDTAREDRARWCSYRTLDRHWYRFLAWYHVLYQ